MLTLQSVIFQRSVNATAGESRPEIEEQIRNARAMSPDGSRVVYDLTTGVDFSNPRLTADILAEVFFKQDVSVWFERNGQSLNFKPEYRAEILVSDNHNREVEKTMKDFFADLRNDEIRRDYADIIENSATYHAGLGTVFFAGLLTALILQAGVRHSEKKSFVSGLLNDIIKNTDVRSMNSM